MSLFILCFWARQSVQPGWMVSWELDGSVYSIVFCALGTWHLTWRWHRLSCNSQVFSIVQEIWLPHAQAILAEAEPEAETDDRPKCRLRNDVLWSPLTSSTGRGNQSARASNCKPSQVAVKTLWQQGGAGGGEQEKEQQPVQQGIWHQNVLRLLLWCNVCTEGIFKEPCNAISLSLSSLSLSPCLLALSFPAEMIYMKAKSQLPTASATSYYRIESVSENCLSPGRRHSKYESAQLLD